MKGSFSAVSTKNSEYLRRSCRTRQNRSARAFQVLNSTDRSLAVIKAGFFWLGQVKLPVVVNDGVANVNEIASEHNVADMNGELPPPQVALRRRFYI